MSHGGEPKVRWYRRGRDEAQHEAQAALNEAAAAFLDLDRAVSDLPDLLAVHRATLAERVAERRSARPSAQSVPPDRLTTDWDAVRAQTDTAFAQYVTATADFDLSSDPEEVETRSRTALLRDATSTLRAAGSQVAQFTAAHEESLARVRGGVLVAPRLLADTAAEIDRAASAVASARAGGLVDPTSEQLLEGARALAGEAAAARDRRAFGVVRSRAAAAIEQARRVADQVAELPARADAVRTGLLATRTRVDALHTQRERLDAVMSQLRRDFSAASWAHIDDVPGRADVDLAAVVQGIEELAALARRTPLDVAAAERGLRTVRAAAAGVGQHLDLAKATLARLQTVAADPLSAIGATERELRDVRRVLRGLEPAQQDRFAPTFDSLARRVETLRTAPRGVVPDWGAVVRELDSIGEGLQSLLGVMRHR